MYETNLNTRTLWIRALALGSALLLLPSAWPSAVESNDEEIGSFPDSESGAPATPDTDVKHVSAGAFFASVIEAKEEIAFLADRKRYEQLLQTARDFQTTLERAPSLLKESDSQRAARFKAASRSLSQLAKAAQNYLWKGNDDALFDAVNKISQLANHIGMLITPEEIAEARDHLTGTNSSRKESS